MVWTVSVVPSAGRAAVHTASNGATVNEKWETCIASHWGEGEAE